MIKKNNSIRLILGILLMMTLIFMASCKSKAPDLPINNTVQNIETSLPLNYTNLYHFYQYANQGQLGISSNSPISIDLVINNVPFDTLEINETPIFIDVSDYTIDGINTLSYSYENITSVDITISQNYPELTNALSDSSFTADELSNLTSYIDNEIAEGFPGAVLLIAHKGQVIYNEAFGYAKLYDGMSPSEAPELMTTDTLFDLASLTKSFSTTLGLMTLEQAGIINSEDLISDYDNRYDSNITFDHLLTHTAGYSSTFRFFDPNNSYGEDFYSLSRTKTLSLLPELSLSYATGSRSIYSDLGYMILGGLVEDITGQTLDQYVTEHIYNSLGLTHILYKPLTEFAADSIAATERAGNTRDMRYEWPFIRTYTLQGEVHDELAYYSMEGISGNAGLFSDASDLAVLSQTLLNGGGYGDIKLFDTDLVQKYTIPSDLYNRYTLGFDVANNPANYSRYGLMSSDLAYGKTGWTGTCVLIDPTYDLVVVLLTNKRHAPFSDGLFETYEMQIGRYSPIITKIYEFLLDESSYASVVTEDTSFEIANIPLNTVGLGIDQFDAYAGLFEGKTVGLITNTSSEDSYGRKSLDIFLNNSNVTTLFAPEHGFEVDLEAGTEFDNQYRDDIPIYSLYGNTTKPTNGMLSNIDIMAYDLQDVGTRYYTYIYTMIQAMEACASNNIPFVVFDRPNIYGDIAFGNSIELEYESFVGDYGLKSVYGLTTGELANYINDTQGINCDLTVVPMTNYSYQNYMDTGLQFVAPSPNMRTIETALLYPGTCLIEGTNLSEGRGTDLPFQLIGASYINPYDLSEKMNALDIPGVYFKPVSFMPTESKEKDRLCFGVYIQITDVYTIDPIRIGLSLIYTLNQLYEEDIEYTDHLNALAGLDLIELLDSDIELDELLKLFEVDDSYYHSLESYYLYK